MINAAGWMLTGKKEEAEAVADSKDAKGRFTPAALRARKGVGGTDRHRMVRFLGVWLSIAFGLWLAAIAIDFMALQCGGQQECAKSFSWLKWLNGAGDFIQSHPARLMVLGLVVPIVGLLVAWQIAFRSRKKAEDSFHPETAVEYEQAGSEKRAKIQDDWSEAVGADATDTALARGDLWGSPGRVAALTRVHLTAPLCAIAAALAFSLAWLEDQTGDSSGLATGLGVFALLVGLWTVSRTLPGGPRSQSGTWWLLAFSAGVLVVVAILAWTIGPKWSELEAGLELEAVAEWEAADGSGTPPEVDRWEAALATRAQFNQWLLYLAMAPIVLLLVVFAIQINRAKYHYSEIIGKEAIAEAKTAKTAKTADEAGKAEEAAAEESAADGGQEGEGSALDGGQEGQDSDPEVGGELAKVHSKWGAWVAAALAVVAGAPVLSGGAIWLGGYMDRFSETDEECLLCVNKYEIAIADFYSAAAVAVLIVIAVILLVLIWYVMKLQLARKPEPRTSWLKPIWRPLQTLFWLRNVGKGSATLSPTDLNERTQKELWKDLVETKGDSSGKLGLAQARESFPNLSTNDDVVAGAWKQHYGFRGWVEGLVGTRLAVEFGILEITRTALWGLGTATALGLWAVVSWGNFLDTLTAWSWPITVAKWAMVALLVAVVGMMYRSYKDSEMRRNVARVWDVITFFPRWFHPFAPPSYAAAALPQLRTHLRVRHQGHPVVIAAHSQGTVLAVATVARLSETERKGVALLTFGSPVRSLYGWFFPRYFGRAEMDVIRTSLSEVHEDNGVGGVRVVIGPPRWRNLRRASDPLAGTIFTKPGHESASGIAWETDVNPTDGSRRVNEVDWILPDPFPEWPAEGDPMPPTKGHSNYQADRPYWTARCELFALLEADPAEVGCPHTPSAHAAAHGDEEVIEE
ncbi:MAG: hypothetical protein GY720_23190 [bacterium]|nr:hypothetical protein [bacterium]